MFGLPRSSGILLHPSSLPGRFGSGDIGLEAHRWIGVMQSTGQRLWQILPLGPTGYGNSPYQSPSTFAANPLLIGIDLLLAKGLLEPEDLIDFPATRDPHRIDFGALIPARTALLNRAADRVLEDESRRRQMEEFAGNHQAWLLDFALYTAIKTDQGGAPWNTWPEELTRRDPEALAAERKRLQRAVEREIAKQFLFDAQWRKLRVRAREAGVTLIGDIPIFVAHDSADVWARPDLFKLDADRNPTVVAGVPPDYFSTTGQRWGNPLYDWEAHEAEDFSWWSARLERVLDQVDVVRIDHFRGFAAAWEIPVHEPTAIEGDWVEGPGKTLFEALRNSHGGPLPIIAEDLGIITDDVRELRDDLGLPGMRVLQFAFGGDALAEEYVPENYPPNSVAYTGTHDNDTTLGMFHAGAGEGSTRTEEEIEAERAQILNYTGTDGSELHWDFLAAVLNSEAGFALAPLQDVLGLGSGSRLNAPGIADGNWEWRFTWNQLDPETRKRLAELTRDAGRVV